MRGERREEVGEESKGRKDEGRYKGRKERGGLRGGNWKGGSQVH